MSNSADHLSVVEGEPEEQDPNADPMVGQTIDGRYQVEKVLGEGGMGLVYKAKHIVLGKPLAIKVLRPDVSRDEEIITRFRQEAQSASSIGNQHIIDISDFGTLPDASTYFIMEFLDGCDLTHAIEEQQPIPASRVVHVGKQLCNALGAAHDAGIVHRDLKPDNIYLIKRGGDTDFVKVLDFGIAKVGGTSSKLTRAGQVFGTPHYMSPEQCSGTGVDHRTDIYAIGVILYEMIVGVTPFDADNLMGILTKHLYEEPIPPTQQAAHCPPELENIILKCMTKSADQRYQTMAEVAEDLQRLEAGLPVSGPPTGAFATQPTVSGMPRPAGLLPEPKKSKTPLIVAAVGVILLGALGGGFAILNSQEEPEPPPPIVEAPPEPEPVPEPMMEVLVEPEPEPEIQMVNIHSEPAGAEVWQGDDLVGNTPLAVPRPDGDSRLTLELRHVGYQNKPFAISSLTVERISFTLRPEPTQRRRSSSRRPRTSQQQTMMAAEPAMTTPMRRSLLQAEVVDPWAN